MKPTKQQTAKAKTEEPPLPPEEWGGMERPRYD